MQITITVIDNCLGGVYNNNQGEFGDTKIHVWYCSNIEQFPEREAQFSALDFIFKRLLPL